MMCQRIGSPPISTIGFGFSAVASCNRVPRPPARMTTFMAASSYRRGFRLSIGNGEIHALPLDDEGPAPHLGVNGHDVLPDHAEEEELDPGEEEEGNDQG